jgi:hypothetical protein
MGLSKIKLAVQIRRISQDGQEMIDFSFSVMRVEPLPLPANTAGIASASRRARARSFG